MALAGLPEDLVKRIHDARPRRPERERHRRNSFEPPSEGAPRPLLSAEADVKKRVAACDRLFQSLRMTAKALAGAGRELQRTAASARTDEVFQEALKAECPPFAGAGFGILEACSTLGGSLTCLSATFTTELLQSLHEMKRTIKSDCASSLAELLTLEEEEESCVGAVKEGTMNTDKLAAELQTSLQEFSKDSKSGGLSSWLRKNPSNRLDDTAKQQRAAIEELANRVDRVSLARMKREKCSDEFQALLAKVDARTQDQLCASIKQCTSVWDDVMESFQHASRLFHGDVKATAGQFGNDNLVARTSSQFSTLTSSTGCFTEDTVVVEARSGLLERLDNTSPVGDGMSFLDEEDEDVEEEALIFSCQHQLDTVGSTSMAETADPNGSAGDSGNSPADCSSRSSLSTPRFDVPPREHAYTVSVGEGVKRLGFEVLWEEDWPSVLKVMPEGEALRAGVCAGDLVEEINGACTRGKGREELMPLLKKRPLRLRLNSCRRRAIDASSDDGPREREVASAGKQHQS